MSKFCVKAAILFSLAIADQVTTAEPPVATQVEATTVEPNVITKEVEATTVEPNVITKEGGTSENLSVSVSTPALEASQEKTIFGNVLKKLRNVGNKVVNPLEFVKTQAKKFEVTLDNLKNKIEVSGGIPENLKNEIETLDNISSEIEPFLSILGTLSPKFDEAEKTINLFKKNVKEYKEGKQVELVVLLENIKNQLQAGLNKLDKFQSWVDQAKNFFNGGMHQAKNIVNGGMDQAKNIFKGLEPSNFLNESKNWLLSNLSRKGSD